LRGKLYETPTQRVFFQDQKESWRSLAQLEVTSAQLDRHTWQAASGRVAVITPAILTNVFGGQIVEVTGVIHLPKPAIVEGTFDYRYYLKQLGIYYQLDATSEQDWRIASSPAHPPIADRFRDWARRALALGLPIEDESLRLEWALTLGWKPALTEEVSEPFVRAATYHIFAVDGLRMAIIFGIFFGLLRALTVPRGLCGVILIPLIWFYTALTSWPASAIRATVMLTTAWADTGSGTVDATERMCQRPSIGSVSVRSSSPGPVLVASGEPGPWSAAFGLMANTSISVGAVLFQVYLIVT